MLHENILGWSKPNTTLQWTNSRVTPGAITVSTPVGLSQVVGFLRKIGRLVVAHWLVYGPPTTCGVQRRRAALAGTQPPPPYPEVCKLATPPNALRKFAMGCRASRAVASPPLHMLPGVFLLSSFLHPFSPLYARHKLLRDSRKTAQTRTLTGTNTLCGKWVLFSIGNLY